MTRTSEGLTQDRRLCPHDSVILSLSVSVPCQQVKSAELAPHGGRNSPKRHESWSLNGASVPSVESTPILITSALTCSVHRSTPRWSQPCSTFRLAAERRIALFTPLQKNDTCAGGQLEGVDRSQGPRRTPRSLFRRRCPRGDPSSWHATRSCGKRCQSWQDSPACIVEFHFSIVENPYGVLEDMFKSLVVLLLFCSCVSSSSSSSTSATVVSLA